MHIKIVLGDERGLSTTMTTVEARQLYDELRTLFEIKQPRDASQKFIDEFINKGLEVGFPNTEATQVSTDEFCTISYCSCMGSKPGHLKNKDYEASIAEKSPETLRERPL